MRLTTLVVAAALIASACDSATQPNLPARQHSVSGGTSSAMYRLAPGQEVVHNFGAIDGGAAISNLQLMFAGSPDVNINSIEIAMQLGLYDLQFAPGYTPQRTAQFLRENPITHITNVYDATVTFSNTGDRTATFRIWMTWD